ncbi:MAG: GNAT family N-acetyltransferase [Anaerolineae bacterium]|nr:GNAT family N-acetyltransferase [Anaerolineae bacterium]
MSASPTALPILHTTRLIIRPFEVGDAEAYHAISAAAFGSQATLATQRRYMQWATLNVEILADLVQPPYGDRAVLRRDSGQIIGAVGLVPSLGPFAQLPALAGNTLASPQRYTPEVGLFWMIAPAHQRCGYASEAALALIEFAKTQLNLCRIVATTEHDNTASIAVMRKLGMNIQRNPLPTPVWFQTIGIMAW